MNGINKLFAVIDDIPVVVKSALAFENCPQVGDIIIAARECDSERIRRLCIRYGVTKLKKVVHGGGTRTASARKAFAECTDSDIIMVHDAARPYVTEELIERVMAAAEKYGAAVPALPVTDTIKFDRDGFSGGTPERASLRAIQTPQAFRADLYDEMMRSGKEATDDAGTAEMLRKPVKLVEGDPANIKITTPDDLPKGEIAMIRIGHGYDVHLFAEGRRLIIGGVGIPYELGLLGHSDADVLIHAVMDALLGSLALGDIGKYFPDTDPLYEDADSTALLKRVAGMLRERGYEVSNLDCTINAEKPKFAPYIPQMRRNIAVECGIDIDRVSVKATTEEGLGLAGKGIGATCVALVKKIAE